MHVIPSYQTVDFYMSADKTDPIRCLSWVVIAELNPPDCLSTPEGHIHGWVSSRVTASDCDLIAGVQCENDFMANVKPFVDLSHSLGSRAATLN